MRLRDHTTLLRHDPDDSDPPDTDEPTPGGQQGGCGDGDGCGRR